MANGFWKLVGKTDDEVKREELELAESMLERKFASAIDDAKVKKLERRRAIQGMFERVRKSGAVDLFDVNKYISLESEIDVLVRLQELLEAKHAELFEEEEAE